MALSCTQGFRIVSWFSVEMEIRTAMTGRFGYSPVGHCRDRSDLFENATLRESDDGKTACFRLRLWRSLLSLLTFCFAMGVLGGPQIHAQVRDKTLSGTVRSPSGAPVANARVLLNDTSNGEMKSVVANSDGSFVLSHLSPGTYEITASKQGFGDIRTIITISADTNAVVNLVTQAGNPPQTGKAQTGSSTVSGVVDSTSVSELPLNGRSASDVATLEPGVATARTQTSGQAQRGFGTQMTISGSRP